MFRILSVFIFCYHIYSYGEGGTHSTSAQCSGEQITRENTKRCDSGTQEEKCLERKHELLDNIGVFEVKVA